MIIDRLGNELIVGAIGLYVNGEKMGYGVITDITLDDNVIICDKEFNPIDIVRLPPKVLENQKDYNDIVNQQTEIM